MITDDEWKDLAIMGILLVTETDLTGDNNTLFEQYCTLVNVLENTVTIENFPSFMNLNVSEISLMKNHLQKC